MSNSYQLLVWGYARNYLASGISVIPCTRDKKPVIEWQKFTTRKANEKIIDDWFHPTQGFIRPYQSIGLVCGAISRNLVVIDLDGIPAVRKFAYQFPNLCESTKSVLTGSQKGIHLYFFAENMPDNINVRLKGVGGFELRGNGQYIIAPPSYHPSGKQYHIHRDNPPLEIDNLDNVRDWMQSLRENEQEKRQAEITSNAVDVPVSVASKRKEAYLRKVLSEEIARVATSATGYRNNSLFYAALRLANYAAGNELDWQDCRTALLLATDLDFKEAYRTVESAYKIGSKFPKVVK